jgi:hypothetical protein
LFSFRPHGPKKENNKYNKYNGIRALIAPRQAAKIIKSANETN